jgi:hypothetical protein
MKNILTKVTQFLVDNNTQIFLSSIMLFIATVSYTRYTQKETIKENKYSEMKYKLDSVSYEYYILENRPMKDVYNRDSVWTVQRELEEE